MSLLFAPDMACDKGVSEVAGNMPAFRMLESVTPLWLKLPFRFKILHPAHKRVFPGGWVR